MIIRLFGLVVVLLTVAVNVFALAGLLHSFDMAEIEWWGIFAQAGDVYSRLTQTISGISDQFVSEQLGITPPDWAVHALIAYLATATALKVSGVGIAFRESALGGVAQAGPKRIVTKFAPHHFFSSLMYGVLIFGSFFWVKWWNDPVPNTALLANEAQYLRRISPYFGGCQQKCENDSVTFSRSPLVNKASYVDEGIPARFATETTMSNSLDTMRLEQPEVIYGIDTRQVTKLSREVEKARQEQKFQDIGKYADRALGIAEGELLTDDPYSMVYALEELAYRFLLLGIYSAADKVYERALVESERHFGAEGPITLQVYYGYGGLCFLMGKYRIAELFLERVVFIEERLRGEEADLRLKALNTLALVYQEQGRHKEAERIFRFIRKVRPEHLDISHNLATVLMDAGHYAEAEQLFLEVIEVVQRRVGGNSAATLTYKHNLAGLYFLQNRYQESELLYKSVLEAKKRLLGILHPDTLLTARNLGVLYYTSGQRSSADALLKKVVRDLEVTLGPAHPDSLYAAYIYAENSLELGRYNQAEQSYLRILSRLGEEAYEEDGNRATADLVRLNMLRGAVFPKLMTSLTTDGYSSAQRSRLLDAFFVALQRINETRVGADIVQASVRAGDARVGLINLTKYLQDLSTTAISIRSQLEFIANRKASAAGDERLATLRAELDVAVETARGIAGEIREKYPDYAELALPQGLSADEVRELLNDGEAVVSYAFVGKNDEEFLLAIVALSDGSLELFRLDVTKATIEERVAKLREGVALPSGGSFDAATLALDLPFDTALAEALYGDLFKPLEDYLGDSDHVIVVADGPLESLPFNLLVRSQAPAEGAEEDLFSVYREAEWLVDRYAVSSVPSISSLKALRDRGSPKGDLLFLGIGHPSLEGKGTTQTASNDNDDDADVLKRITLGLGDKVDIKRVKELEPVPQTAGMLQALAIALNADSKHVLLQDDAEERDLRALEKDETLKRYQTIAFGTHALIARELQQVGLNEPALVLSPPANDNADYNPDNDGLFRASEVVGLTLDADWVLLTACNTAAPDGTLGAEPLTGLAKSFFYAGARSLLVSHWPAEANATARLAPAIIIETNTGTSKAQALRNAMRQMKQDTNCGPNTPTTQTCPENAHPALWATFTISGEAG